MPPPRAQTGRSKSLMVLEVEDLGGRGLSMSDVVTKITCPHCHRTGSTTKTVSAGAKIKCPGCGEAFAYQPAEPAVARPTRPEITLEPAFAASRQASPEAPEYVAPATRPIPAPYGSTEPARPYQSPQEPIH